MDVDWINKWVTNVKNIKVHWKEGEGLQSGLDGMDENLKKQQQRSSKRNVFKGCVNIVEAMIVYKYGGPGEVLECSWYF